MKLLCLKLANVLTGGKYLDACKAAAHHQSNYLIASEKLVMVERGLKSTEQHLKSAERALIEKDRIISDLHEGLDRIVRYGEGKIGPKGNGSLRRVVRMAEAMLYPSAEVNADATSQAYETVKQRRHLRDKRDLAQAALLEDMVSQQSGVMTAALTASALAATCSSDTSGSSFDSSSAGGDC